MTLRVPSLVALAISLAACRAHRAGEGAQSRLAAAPPAVDQIERQEFTSRAQEHFLPLFWRADDNGNKTLDPGELAVLWGPQRARRADYVDERGFTPAFFEAYLGMLGPIDLATLPAD